MADLDITDKLYAVTVDGDNFPRMKTETHLPIGLAHEAADEINKLRKQVRDLQTKLEQCIRGIQE